MNNYYIKRGKKFANFFFKFRQFSNPRPNLSPDVAKSKRFETGFQINA